MRVGSGVAELPPQQLEHGGGTLRVHVLLVEPPRQLALVLVANHLEELDVTVQGLVFVFTEFFDYWKLKRAFY